MNTKRDPREIAETILSRSTCSVQVGACLADDKGVFAWGWNHVGDGFGKHAEAHCIVRSSRKRRQQATLYVASVRRRNNKVINSKPCPQCHHLIDIAGIERVLWRDADGMWRQL